MFVSIFNKNTANNYLNTFSPKSKIELVQTVNSPNLFSTEAFGNGWLPGTGQSQNSFCIWTSRDQKAPHLELSTRIPLYLKQCPQNNHVPELSNSKQTDFHMENNILKTTVIHVQIYKVYIKAVCAGLL